MPSAIVASLALIANAAAPAGEPASTGKKSCPDVLDYRSWKEVPDQVWDFRSAKASVIGASHSRDPAHAQFAHIEHIFTQERPSLVFFEGPDRGIAETAEETIKSRGESGYLRFLARQAGVSARSLEPSPPDQVKALLTEFPGDQVLLFFVLREATRLRDREGVAGEALEARVGELLKRIGPMAAAVGMNSGFSETAELQQAFARYWPGRDWKTAEAGWFSPGGDDQKTGGVFAAAINRADSTNRDRHLLRLLSESVASGEKPMVVVGRNHVPMIAPALECLLRD